MQVLQKNVPENVPEKFNTTLGKISQYIDRLNNLISELLDVSRIQTGNIELHEASVNFDKMVSEVIEGIQASAHNHRIVLKGQTEATVIADESHIIQVLNNLLSNAIKYSPNSPSIEVHISNVSEYVKVSIKDFGIGMSAEDKKRVFERFFRGNDIQKRFPGMGIGLYVCDQIIKNHKGTLWVESEKEQGSTFNFTLPKGGKEVING